MEENVNDPINCASTTIILEADEEVLELIDLLEQVNQPNFEKYEILKPLFERLNLYCDEQSIRFEKDSDCFAIPLEAISGVIYEEIGDVLYLLFQQNRNLHTFYINTHQHIIYTASKRHNSILSLFLNIYKRISFKFAAYKARKRFKQYLKEK